MRFYSLPPVRRTVPLRRGDSTVSRSMERFFGDRRVTLWSSGTAALSEAIRRCALRSGANAPEVILPAYGCPDLISACIHASVIPRLIDLAPELWSYDYAMLTRQVTANTVAIVAVNLLGIGDDAAQLREFCDANGIALIQDSAQHLPRTAVDWPGDYVVLSFGRGKPLNLLQGGALVSPFETSRTQVTTPTRFPFKTRLLTTRAAGVAFDALTHPWIYGVLSALPGTGLGDVVYEPLDTDARLPDSFWRIVGPAFEQYRITPSYRHAVWSPAFDRWSALGIQELKSPAAPSNPEPLRLALLAPDRGSRDAIVESFNHAGIGSSPLYGTDLPGISGIPEVVKAQRPFPQAARLAGRLFTLPTHSFVNARTVRTSLEVLDNWRHVSRPTLPRDR